MSAQTSPDDKAVEKFNPYVGLCVPRIPSIALTSRVAFPAIRP
jgi:hypothetical protein